MATVMHAGPIQRTPDKPGVVDEMRQFDEDSRFLSLHRDALLHEYPEEWVAVFNGEVVAHSANSNGILRHLARKKIPRGRVAISFLTRKPHTFIL